MADAALQKVADVIVLRAKQQGYVRPRDIRMELADAGLSEDQWKDVVAIANDSLECRQGRYYHQHQLTEPQSEDQYHKQVIRRTIRELIRRHQQSKTGDDRRQEDRFEFIQPVQIETEDGRHHTLLSRDVSMTGLRLIGTQGFLGQKLKVALRQDDISEPSVFVVRILWTCAVADGLYESGGAFVDVL